MFQDVCSNSEDDSGDKDGMVADNGIEIKFESIESTEQIVCEESLSSTESEVSIDKTNY